MTKRRPSSPLLPLGRRGFLQATAGAASAALFGTGVSCSGSAAPRRPRNIVLITGDDLGWRDTSGLGNPNVSTPNLDRLMRGGVSFSRAFDVTSTCASSRTTYVTGQYPHTHGVTALVHRNPELSLPVEQPTMATHLRGAGYHTVIEGKWHVAYPESPIPYGYDLSLRSYILQWIFDSSRTQRFIEGSGAEPFYFEINYMNPHRDYFGAFNQHEDHPVDPGSLVIPDYYHLPDVPGFREELAAYYSQVDRMDVMIGELIAAVEAQGVFDDTLFVFISDNGIAFPHNKQTVHDRGTGTPLFFHWPAGLPAGVVRDELVCSVDLMPTILDIAGVLIPDDVQGSSLRALLLDPAATWERDAIFAEMTAHSGAPVPARSVRTDRYRYIRNYNDRPHSYDSSDMAWMQEIRAMNLPEYPWGQPRVPEELYDVLADPQEQTNLIADAAHADALEGLRARLDAHMTATADPYLGQPFETVT
ncbi:MAG: sulfatase [Polyangiales bacterium]